LIIVRPTGVKFYYYVREAIQSWDSEFGYELVEEDWDLKYGAADPQLATVEYDAAEAARARLRALAEAAPQAYGAYRFGNDAGDSWGGDFSDSEGDGAFGAGGGGGGTGGNGSGETGGRVVGSNGRGAGGPGGGRIAAVIVKRQDSNGADESGTGESRRGETTDGNGKSNDAASGNPAGQADAGQSPAGQGSLAERNTAPGNIAQPGQTGAQGQPGQSGSPADNFQDNRSYASGNNSHQYQQSEQKSHDAAADEDGAAPPSQQKTRGKNWAIRHANASQIPIRRTIQIEVRGDALAILAEASSTNSAAATGREFPFRDAPLAAYEDLLSAVDRRIEDWGMAGQGLYWRPVIELRIGADGDRRVDDLVRLLEHGGAEIRGESMAQQASGGANGTTQ
jgi:hypothetical protein